MRRSATTETLLEKVSFNPAMGNYLDAVNNDRPAGTRVPNENYAREIMQLFSIGLVELNPDGTPLLDAQGRTIQTYGQTEIAEFARIFTGMTYSSAANPAGPADGQAGPLLRRADGAVPDHGHAGHDPNPKTLLNGTVTAGRPDRRPGLRRGGAATCSCIRTRRRSSASS